LNDFRNDLRKLIESARKTCRRFKEVSEMPLDEQVEWLTAKLGVENVKKLVRMVKVLNSEFGELVRVWLHMFMLALCSFEVKKIKKIDFAELIFLASAGTFKEYMESQQGDTLISLIEKLK